jgi:hypothetical protein
MFDDLAIGRNKPDDRSNGSFLLRCYSASISRFFEHDSIRTIFRSDTSSVLKSVPLSHIFWHVQIALIIDRNIEFSKHRSKVTSQICW